MTNTLLIGSGGLTGQWYARLLLQQEHKVFAYDSNNNIEYNADLLANKNFVQVSDQEFNSFNILSKLENLTLSPGVPLSLPIFTEAKKRSLNIFSELEFCMPFFDKKKKIAITGTDGKSTVTALITHLLNTREISAVACGNFGLPFSQLIIEKIELKKASVLVMELSSYQLEMASNLHPQVAIYLNLAEDHLDRYDSLADYGRMKWNIAKNLSEDSVLIANRNLLPPNANLWGEEHPLKAVFRRLYKENNKIQELIKIDCQALNSGDFKVVTSSDGNYDLKAWSTSGWQTLDNSKNWQIKGKHNFSNLLFSIEAVKFISAKIGFKLESLKQALTTFRPLAHRFETISVKGNYLFINDSKATTTQAVINGVNGIQGELFIFLGGRSKNEDYTNLIPSMSAKRINICLYGECRVELEKVFSKVNLNLCCVEENLELAFYQASKVWKTFSNNNPSSNVTILLAPAATSWDQYKNFEARGNHFVTLVQEYLKKLKGKKT